MNSNQETPIIMVEGWNLSEWEDWIDNDEIGKIAFQFGTRPLLTKKVQYQMLGKTLTIKN